MFPQVNTNPGYVVTCGITVECLRVKPYAGNILIPVYHSKQLRNKKGHRLYNWDSRKCSTLHKSHIKGRLRHIMWSCIIFDKTEVGFNVSHSGSQSGSSITNRNASLTFRNSFTLTLIAQVIASNYNTGKNFYFIWEVAWAQFSAFIFVRSPSLSSYIQPMYLYW